LYLFFDAVTGKYYQPPQPAATTAQVNLNAAKQTSRDWAGDAQLLMVGTHQSDISPNGEAQMWYYIFHSASLDSDQVFIFSNNILLFQGQIWQPPSMNPLPPDWMDSDAASYIAESHGGNLYRINFQDAMVDASVARGLLPQQLERTVWQFRYRSYVAPAMDIFIDAVSGAYIPTQVNTEPSDNRIPQKFSLNQNYPNPFNPETAIEYQIAHPEDVEISIMNLQGQKVKTLVQNFQNAGSYTIHWDGKNESGQPVTSGVYTCRFKAGDFVEVKKMLLLR
jgi:hypothetical protein